MSSIIQFFSHTSKVFYSLQNQFRVHTVHGRGLPVECRSIWVICLYGFQALVLWLPKSITLFLEHQKRVKNLSIEFKAKKKKKKEPSKTTPIKNLYQNRNKTKFVIPAYEIEKRWVAEKITLLEKQGFETKLKRKKEEGKNKRSYLYFLKKTWHFECIAF